MSDPIRTGNLKKREDKGELTWKKRFGVLYEDRLDWWKTDVDFQNGKKEHGRCPLNSECTTGEADAESKRSNTFFIERTRSNGKKQRFFFKADSAEDRGDWIKNLNSVISGEAKAASGGGSSDAPAGDAPAGDAPAGDAPAGDAPSGDAPAGDAPSGDAPAEDAPPAGDDAPPAEEPVSGDEAPGEEFEEEAGGD
jgi:hypothetical protein